MESIRFIQGPFSFRPLNDDADFESMAKIESALRDADQTENARSASELKHMFSNIANFNLSSDLLLAQEQDEVLGFCYCFWEMAVNNGGIVLHLSVFTHPKSPHTLDQQLFDWGYSRLEEIYQAIPGHMPAELRTFAWEKHKKRHILFAANGLTAVRHYFNMRRDLLSEPIPEKPLPNGIIVRPALPSEYRKIWDSSVIAFNDEWGAVIPTETDFVRWQGETEFQPFLWQVGWLKDQPVGMVTNFVNLEENEYYQRHRGYTEGIWVLPEFRKHGLASALIARSLEMFKSMNMHEAALGVDSQNPSGAFGLYEGLGFQTYSRAAEYSKPFK